jgi:hypothetical protein
MTQILHGIQITDRVVHLDAKHELLTKRVARANRINASIMQGAPEIKGGRKDFRKEMTNLVKNKK